MLDRGLLYLLCLFAFSSFISLAVGSVTLGLAILLFFIYAYKNKLTLPVFGKGYLCALGLMAGALLLSALGSGDIMRGLRFWGSICLWRVMPFVIVLLFVDTKYKSKLLFKAMVLGFAVALAYLLYQGVNGNLRAPGFFGHPMTFGGWLCIFVPALFVLFYESVVKRQYVLLAGILFAASLIGLYVNGTRGAWVALPPVALFIIYAYRNKYQYTKWVALALMLAVTGLAVGSSHFQQRALSIANLKTDKSNTERVLIWRSACNMFKDHPVLGVGLGQYKDNYQKKYILPQAIDPKLEHAHNNIMQMLAENGIVGCAAYVGLFAYILGRNIIIWRKSGNPYALVIVCSTLALCLQGLTEYNFGNTAVMRVYWLHLGCMVTALEISKTPCTIRQSGADRCAAVCRV